MREKLRVVVADDERPARSVLLAMLHTFEDVDVVGEARDGSEAVEVIERERPDLALLDLQMPEVDGLGVVRLLKRSAVPMVAFVTAYDEYAVRAFEVNAVDYLLKPVEAARLDRALDRVATRRADAAGDLRSVLERLARDLRGGTFLDHLASRIRDRVQLVPVEEVTHVVARDRATYAVTAAAEHLLDMTIAELERRLDPARFFHIHRGTLVNVAWVAQLRANEDGHLQVCLKDAKRSELVVARDRVRPLKERLGLV
jgi:two-component system LytT family response regulator